jgi:SAM-dependent methyltransferase
MTPKTFARKLHKAWIVYQDSGSQVILEKIAMRLRRVFKPDDPDWALSIARVDTEFDAKYGTDTGGIKEIFDLRVVGHNRKHGECHIATNPKAFGEMMQSLSINASAYTFVDLGCGKGRALILAANYGFKRVVGVEFVREFFEIAKTNITRLQLKDAEVILGDAAAFEFPTGPVLLYLCNPFDSQIVAEVARNARLSWIREKRPFSVAYVTPVHQDTFISSGWAIETTGIAWIQLKCTE